MHINNILCANYVKSIFQRKMSTDVKNFVKNGKKILGAAFNYKDPTKAGNAPSQPVLFLKPSSSYITEGQDIVLPKLFTRVAHEVELGVIIGKKCKNVAKDEAMCFVGGYCLGLDLTAQCELGEARKNGRPWSIGKGFDTSTPVSRLIELNEIQDPTNITVCCKINGEVRQNGNTSDLIYGIPELIEYISKYMTLEPSDLILTGTPSGAAPMSPGDVLECSLGDIVSMCFNVK